jgi:adenosyl cobinamide kinase/adenosyl cobinamide phosphate guanylyltransferase
MKPSELISKNIKMLVYGTSSSGKSYFASGADNALVLDLEKGMASAQRDDIDILPVNSAREFKEAIEYAAKSDYDTIIIDSLTKYSEMLFIAVKEAYPDPKQSMLMWMNFDAAIRSRVTEILAIDKHIIFTTLVEDVVTEDGWTQRYPMLKAKKFKMMVTSFFDLVLYIDVEDNERKIHLRPGSDYVAKNRLANKVDLPDVIGESDKLFNAQEIINKIKGEA